MLGPWLPDDSPWWRQRLNHYAKAKAAAEWAWAASCEEQVACLLDADGQELEAAIHRVSAAL